MTRKLSTMGLACLMALVMLNACCGFALAEELEPVELTVWLNDAVGTADQEVTDYINNLEEIKALNVTIHFRKSISGEDNAQAKMCIRDSATSVGSQPRMRLLK